MLRSLVLHCSCARIYVLCMDEETYNLLGRIEIPGVIRVRLSEVENDELLSVKSERSQAEYCWTLTAFFTWYVMDTHREIDAITYLDSDLNDAESALLKTIKIYWWVVGKKIYFIWI